MAKTTISANPHSNSMVAEKVDTLNSILRDLMQMKILFNEFPSQTLHFQCNSTEPQMINNGSVFVSKNFVNEY